jgi:hypothetical protein
MFINKIYIKILCHSIQKNKFFFAIKATTHVKSIINNDYKTKILISSNYDLRFTKIV